MHPQLQEVVDEFESAQARLQALAERAPAEEWGRRPAPARWSVAECVAHLNLTSTAFLPRIREALIVLRRLAGPAPPRYRRDPIGWILWNATGPPVRVRLNTPPAFVPAASESPGALVQSFLTLQAELVECVRGAEGLPLGRITITSPFDSRVSYNLYSGLTILPRHQHRHLWQAEQAWRELQTQ